MLVTAITGHRPGNLPPDWRKTLPRDLALIMAAIAGAERKPVMLSGLAAGADSAAADAALANGVPLVAILPFSQGDYAADFGTAQELDDYRRLLDAASRITALPGQRTAAVAAYTALGQELARRCDILIAVWDGLPGRGRGGTADVMRMARQAGRPVITVTPQPGTNRIALDGAPAPATAISPAAAETVVRAALESLQNPTTKNLPTNREKLRTHE